MSESQTRWCPHSFRCVVPHRRYVLSKDSSQKIVQLCFVTCNLFRMERVKDGPAVDDCLQFRFLHLDFNLLFTFLFQFSVPNIFFSSFCVFFKCRSCFDVWVAGVQILNDGRMKEEKVKHHSPPRRSSPQNVFLLHLGPSSSPTWKPKGDHKKEH